MKLLPVELKKLELFGLLLDNNDNNYNNNHNYNNMLLVLALALESK